MGTSAFPGGLKTQTGVGVGVGVSVGAGVKVAVGRGVSVGYGVLDGTTEGVSRMPFCEAFPIIAGEQALTHSNKRDNNQKVRCLIIRV